MGPGLRMGLDMKYPPFPVRHRPGSKWRTLAHRVNGTAIQQHSSDHDDPTEFDELVIDAWLHIEQMDTRWWWMQIGPLAVNVHVGKAGRAERVIVDVTDPGPNDPPDHNQVTIRGFEA